MMLMVGIMMTLLKMLMLVLVVTSMPFVVVVVGAGDARRFPLHDGLIGGDGGTSGSGEVVVAAAKVFIA